MKSNKLTYLLPTALILLPLIVFLFLHRQQQERRQAFAARLHAASGDARTWLTELYRAAEDLGLEGRDVRDAFSSLPEEEAIDGQEALAGRIADGAAKLAGEEGSEAVLQLTELLLPWLEENAAISPVGALAWTLDYFPGREAGLRERTEELRQAVARTLRSGEAPPGPETFDWVEVPGGDEPSALPPFRLLRHEVTNGEFRRLRPAHPETAGALPVIGVSWYEAYAYAAWIGGRLPTEAEWSYAARAGCEATYCDRAGNAADLTEVAWSAVNCREVQAVEGREPNPWGLFDMYGNVWEWVADWYGPDRAEGAGPWGPAEGNRRVIRGGGCTTPPAYLEPGYRFYGTPGYRYSDTGFRVVLPADGA